MRRGGKALRTATIVGDRRKGVVSDGERHVDHRTPIPIAIDRCRPIEYLPLASIDNDDLDGTARRAVSGSERECSLDNRRLYEGDLRRWQWQNAALSQFAQNLRSLFKDFYAKPKNSYSPQGL